jgi:hypothetical protein
VSRICLGGEGRNTTIAGEVLIHKLVYKAVLTSHLHSLLTDSKIFDTFVRLDLRPQAFAFLRVNHQALNLQSTRQPAFHMSSRFFSAFPMPLVAAAPLDRDLDAVDCAW